MPGVPWATGRPQEVGGPLPRRPSAADYARLAAHGRHLPQAARTNPERTARMITARSLPAAANRPPLLAASSQPCLVGRA